MISKMVELALAGRCVMCERRLPKRKRILLFNALANIWKRGSQTDCRSVEVYVCGESCRQKYDEGEIVA